MKYKEGDKVVILISGKARSGKTTIAGMIQQEIGGEIIPFAKHLKAQAVGLGWDGEKDDKGRTLLQVLGDVVKQYHGLDYYAGVVCQQVKGIVIVDDWRYPYEKDVFGENVVTIRVNRRGDNGLSEEQKAHPSETALDNGDFNVIIENSKSLEELEEWVKIILKAIGEQYEI